MTLLLLDVVATIALLTGYLAVVVRRGAL